jgi:hypothetical protein
MSMDDKVQGVRALTHKLARCSNPACEFFNKDTTFRAEPLYNIMYDVLRKNDFAPIQCGSRFFCLACDWVFTINQVTGKPVTVHPDTDPQSGEYKRELGG